MQQVKNDLYAVPLNKAKLQVLLFAKETVQKIMHDNNFQKIEELNSEVLRIFKTQSQAEKYIQKVESAKNSLPLLKERKKDNAPCLLLRRNLLASVAIGDKIKTARKFKKTWNKGTKFYFHDQTHYIDCKLTDVIKINETCYIYEFQKFDSN